MNIQKVSRLGGMLLVGLIALAAVVAAWGINTIRFGGGMHLQSAQYHEFNADILPPPQYLLEPFMEANLLALYPRSYNDHADRLEQQKAVWLERKAYWATSDAPAILKDGIAQTSAQDGTRFWDEIDNKLKPAVSAGNNAAARASLQRLLLIYRDHRAAIDGLVTATADLQTELANDSKATISWVTATLIAAGLAIVASVIAALVMLSRKVLVPLSHTSNVMKEMANGNLEIGKTSTHRGDEIGEMTKAIEFFREASQKQRSSAAKQEKVVARLTDGLRDVAGGDLTAKIRDSFDPEYESLRKSFNETVESLAQIIATVRGSVSSVSIGSGEIRIASEDLAQRNEQQAASIEESAAEMKQVTSLIKKTAENVAEAKTLMKQTHSEASDGGAVVTKAVEAMSSIEKSSTEITQIIDLIDGIAFQTNLLALNAGVEAARAGDAGKGFAVVANEVRALAQRSAEAAQSIKDLINASTQQVSDGSALVSEAGGILDAIVARISDVNSEISDIADMAVSQAESLENVNVSVGNMDRMTQQNAAMVEQTTAAARNLADEATMLGKQVDQFVTSGVQSNASSYTGPTAVSVTTAQQSIAAAPAAKAAPRVAGNLALSADHDKQDWSEF